MTAAGSKIEEKIFLFLNVHKYRPSVLLPFQRRIAACHGARAQYFHDLFCTELARF
jgi:hypothetical protein